MSSQYNLLQASTTAIPEQNKHVGAFEKCFHICYDLKNSERMEDICSWKCLDCVCCEMKDEDF